jgi:uncharacterized membrane protein YphA (DoxX/SURF4 family)
MLVLLRMTIGWHFYSEGVDKYQQGDWDAKPFFANARGPVAQQFRQLVWDWDGAIRLDAKKTQVHLAMFRDRVGAHFEFDAKQKKLAQANYAKAAEQLESVLLSNEEDIEEYRLGKSRVEKLESDLDRNGVASLAGQTATIRAEWTKKIAPTFSQIDAIWESYEQAQNNLATLEQAGRNRPLKLGVPRTQMMDTSIINKFVPYFDIAVGVCLLFGFLTPVAALAAAGFLGSVFLSQYPPVTGPSSSTYQLIEAVACLVLAATGSGRFAGLDFIVQSIIRKLWPQAAE